MPILNVNELYGPVSQGEGNTRGMPCHFLRMAGCNLSCGWCFGWYPDVGRQPFITMAKGGKEKLGELCVGDKLLTLDDKGRFVETTVTGILKYEVDEWVRAVIRGTAYYMTLDHRLFTNRGLMEAKNLEKGDEIMDDARNGVLVTSVRIIDQMTRFPLPVTGLTCEPYPTYLADGMWQHNCDTPYTWNWIGTHFKHPQKFDKKAENHKVMSDDLLSEIRRFGRRFPSIRMLVVTGGEPLLQQARLPPLLGPLKNEGWRIELETNGTISPSRSMFDCVTQFNVSPKLLNSGQRFEHRLRHDALMALSTNENCIFKFVVRNYEENREIKEIVNTFNLRQVWLMPEATTREEHEKSEPMVALMAKQNGWNYTPRDHILMYGNERRR